MLFQGFGERRMNLGLCLHIFPCPGEEGQTMGRPFIEDSFEKSQQPALSIRQMCGLNLCEMLAKRFAGTGLGSCSSWILILICLKSAVRCLI